MTIEGTIRNCDNSQTRNNNPGRNALTDLERFAALIAGLEDQGLSRDDIARQSNLSPATVWRYATQNVRQPSYQTASRIESLAKKYAISTLK
jgi:DNA-binding NarL/FixJ family response regulator